METSRRFEFLPFTLSSPPGIEVGDGRVAKVLALSLQLALEVDRQHDADGGYRDDRQVDHDVTLERQILDGVRAALAQNVVIAVGTGKESGGEGEVWVNSLLKTV